MRFTKVGGRREEAHIVIIRREKKVTSQEWLQSKKKGDHMMKHMHKYACTHININTSIKRKII